jgi:hypothetical protein
MILAIGGAFWFGHNTGYESGHDDAWKQADTRLENACPSVSRLIHYATDDSDSESGQELRSVDCFAQSLTIADRVIGERSPGPKGLPPGPLGELQTDEEKEFEKQSEKCEKDFEDWQNHVVVLYAGRLVGDAGSFRFDRVGATTQASSGN